MVKTDDFSDPIEQDMYKEAHKWWNSLNEPERRDYEQRFLDSIGDNLTSFRWASEDDKIYHIFTSIKCLE